MRHRPQTAQQVRSVIDLLLSSLGASVSLLLNTKEYDNWLFVSSGSGTGDMYSLPRQRQSNECYKCCSRSCTNALYSHVHVYRGYM